MIRFASDNTSPMAPELFAALEEANAGYVPSYGEDQLSAAMWHAFSELFQREVAVFLTSTGTAANALSIAGMCPPWKRVLCQRFSHVMESECGAPEAFSGGGKLVPVQGNSEKISAIDIDKEAGAALPGDPHAPRVGLVSMSQATELGTVYAVEEIAAIGSACRRSGAKLHMDGARFANASATLGHSPAELTWKAGVDVLSLGAAKNGGALGDAIVLFDLERAEEFRYRQMRAGHLVAKQRYLAAQMLAYLRDGLWLRLARTANQRASEFADMLARGGFELARPVQANELFALLPASLVNSLQNRGHRLKTIDARRLGRDANDLLHVVRFVTSWNTSRQDVLEAMALVAN